MPAVSNARFARRRIGTAGAKPSLKSVTRPSSSRSGPRATGAAGAALAACATSSVPPPRAASRPAKNAAASASRYVSRARTGSSRLSRRAAVRNSGATSRPCVETNATRARSRSPWARSRSSSSSASAVSSSPTASSSAPARNFVCAAASARRPRGAESGVSEAARSRNAAAAAKPPRACARAAERSSSAATSSSGSEAARARCHARRSGSISRIGRLGEGAMDLAPLARPGGPVDGRADERMTEHHAGSERQEAFRLGGVRGRLGDPEPLGRPPDERRIADGVARRDQQQPPRVLRKRRQPPPVALLDAGRQRRRCGEAEAARELRRGQAARQLEQRQRVPVRLGDDPLEHALVEPGGQRGLQEQPRVAMGQRLDRQRRQPREGVTDLARREQEHDPLRRQPAGHERECPCRRSVEPLCVIDDAEQRPLLRGLGQEPEHRQPDQERIRLPGREAEGDAQRVALGLRQVLHELEDRRAQLLQRRERQLHLRLDPRGPHDAELRRRLDRPLEQGGLADAWLPVHDGDAGLPAARGSQQLVEQPALALPADQLPSGQPRDPAVLRSCS